MALPSAENARLAHLLRRAGFGARPAEWAAYTRLGLAGSTQQLLHPEDQPDHLKELLGEIYGDFVDFDDINSVRQWWLYRMIHTQRPLEEKMTLFWHNHFATAYYKVGDSQRMWTQNETFRKYGLGSFRTLLQKVACDPAMLVWLDGQDNRVGKPNENFGREVMELFTMGVHGGYTETDVQEAARAYTGWHQGDSPTGFVYDPFAHDDGSKTVLGYTGNFHTDDVLDILAHHPSTAKFITTKLFKFFVHDQPTDGDIQNLTDVYYSSGFDIRSILQTIFTSDVFYSDEARFAKIKSPVEFTVSSIRTLDAPMTAVRDLSGSLALMGQDLFNPPNVKGWAEGRTWINTRTLLARVNFASNLTGEMSRRVSMMDRIMNFTEEDGGVGQTAAAGGANPAAAGDATMAGTTMAGATMADTTMVPPTMAAGDTMMAGGAAPGPATKVVLTPDAAVDAVWNAFMPGLPMSDETRQGMLGTLQDNGKPNVAGRLPALFSLVVSLPEYQLC